MRAMARVEFTTNLRRHLDCPVRDAPGDTLRAVLENVFTGQPRLRSYLLDDQGRLRRHVAIYINGTRVSDRIGLTDKLEDEDEVYVFQALSGG